MKKAKEKMYKWLVIFNENYWLILNCVWIIFNLIINAQRSTTYNSSCHVPWLCTIAHVCSAWPLTRNVVALVCSTFAWNGLSVFSGLVHPGAGRTFILENKPFTVQVISFWRWKSNHKKSRFFCLGRVGLNGWIYTEL